MEEVNKIPFLGSARARITGPFRLFAMSSNFSSLTLSVLSRHYESAPGHSSAPPNFFDGLHAAVQWLPGESPAMVQHRNQTGGTYSIRRELVSLYL